MQTDGRYFYYVHAIENGFMRPNFRHKVYPVWADSIEQACEKASPLAVSDGLWGFVLSAEYCPARRPASNA